MDDLLALEKAALNRAAKMLGGQAAIATACGFTDRRHVWPWFNNPERRVPAEHCPAIERATKERARITGEEPVLCEELRHGVDWAVLREQFAVPPEPAKAA